MCATCGCGDAEVRVNGLPVAGEPEPVPGRHRSVSHDHHHGSALGATRHDHVRATPAHGDEHAGEPTGRLVDIEVALLAKNDRLAASNRAWLAERDAVALNLMSSPGAGKTTLLQRTIVELAGSRPVAVVEGDQETRLDAERIRGTGAPVVQINTGAGCHLDAAMLAHGLRELEPPRGALVLVENVGNLVCPALFDLGEVARVVVVSVTEGEDKPLKYPQMFAAADVVVITKTDLLPYVDVDLDRLTAHCRTVNPSTVVLPLSVKTGEGTGAWVDWVTRARP